MLICNGVVHPMDAPDIPQGYVWLEEGRIRAVGPMDRCPREGYGEKIDARGGHILPGFVDPHCHVGLTGDSDGTEDLWEPGGGAQLRALDALDWDNRYFQEARRAGVTTVVVSPGSGAAVGGQIAAVKTGGPRDRRVLLAPAALKIALGENVKGRAGGCATRMGTAAALRALFTRAVEYADALDRADSDPASPLPGYDPELEALTAVVRGSLPVHVHAHRGDDIRTALSLREEFGLKLVLLHGTEGDTLGEELAAAEVPVVAGPILNDRSKPELRRHSEALAGRLHRAGVTVALCTDHPEVPIHFLPLCAALAVKYGLPPQGALEAVTLTAARIAGVDRRVGSLTPGKDGDVVVLDGPPLDIMSRVTHVIIGGKECDCHERADL